MGQRQSSTVSVEASAPLSLERETELLGAALADAPQNPVLRARLIGRLVRLDRFDEALALAQVMPEQPNLLLIINHCRALFAQRTTHCAQRAFDLVTNQLPLPWSDPDRARLLAEQAKACLRLGQERAAEETLLAALALEPGCEAAFKRLTNVMFRAGRYGAVLALIEQLQQHGAKHTRMLAALSLARVGSRQEQLGRALLAEDWLPPPPTLRPPRPWADLASLNQAAAAELLGDKALRFDRVGTASRQTWRVDHPGGASQPAVQSLLVALADAIAAWIADLPALDHPWLAQRPQHLTLRSWSVITSAEGHEQWHMHPEGWLSGGYYLQVPPGIEQSDDPAGCLAFGMPPGLVGAAASQHFGLRLTRPHNGLLRLFPSHAYHRTFPHGQPEQRICLAFDLIEARAAG